MSHRSPITLALAGILLAAAPVPAQSRADPAAPGDSPFSHMHMLLERTIFQVDVLTLDVCVGQPTAAEIAPWARSGINGAAADSIAAAMIGAGTLLGRIRFLRDVGLDRFLEGVRDDQARAVEAGLLADSTYRMISDSLPVWFGFLEERGLNDGDQIVYLVRGDSLRTVYRNPEGEVLLDQTDVGEDRRRAVIATWFAPGSSFREPLLRSLDHRDDARRENACSVPAPGPPTSRAGYPAR